MAELVQTPVNDATSRFDRELAALRPADGAIDSRSRSQLLDFGPGLASLIHFYDLADQPDGTWVEFFSSDPMLVMAGIAATDTHELDGRLDRLHARVRRRGNAAALGELIELAVALARRFDRWQVGLQVPVGPERGQSLAARIRTAIDEALGGELRVLRSMALSAERSGGLGEALTLDFDGFGAAWRLAEVVPDDSLFAGRTRAEKLERAASRVRAAFDAFSQVLAGLQPEARRELESSVEGGHQRPQLALWIAYVRLFGRAQRAINSLGHRFPDFYYRDVLRMRRGAAEPDRAYLCFTMPDDEEVLATRIPAGMIFQGGETEQGEALSYASIRPLDVSPAALEQVRTLRVVRTCLAGEGGCGQPAGGALWVPQQIFESRIDLDALAEAQTDEQADRGRRGFATFGRAQVEAGAVEQTTLARLGFAIETEQLALGSGTRTITLELRYALEFGPTLEQRLLAIGGEGIDPELLFADVLRAAFALRVTTSAGWLAVDGYEVEPPPSMREGRFSLRLSLPASVAALAGLENEDGTLGPPTLEALLRQQALEGLDPPVFPISVLDGMPVVGVAISVHVVGSSSFTLENPEGEVSPGGPFAIFGGSPVVGSYLRLRSDELFDERLEHLEVTLDWYDLPQDATGFAGYYANWHIGPDGERRAELFDNRSFEVDIGIAEAGPWTLTQGHRREGGSEVWLAKQQLFRTRPSEDGACGDPDPRARLCERTVFVLEVEPHEQPGYYDPSSNWLELRLCSPSYAFGDAIYPQNVLAAVVGYLPDCVECTSACEAAYLPLQTASEKAATCVAETGASDQECLYGVLGILVAALVGCTGRSSDPQGSDALSQLARWRKPSVQTSIKWGTSAPSHAELVSLLERERAGAAATGDCTHDCGPLWAGAIAVVVAIGTGDATQLAGQLANLYQRAVEACVSCCGKPPAQLEYPNPPYLPQTLAVTIEYRARGQLDGAFYHLLPFDGRRRVEPSELTKPTLLPSFDNQGNLYLGFARLPARSALTLLFELSTREVDTELPRVCWGYLSAAGWVGLARAALGSDTTAGLRDTGIVELRQVGRELGSGGGFSDELHWLRAVVAEQPEAFPATLAIHPHAVVVVSQGSASDPGDCYHELPAGTITSAVEELPDIETIAQPMPSFGGRPAETDRALWLRAGERVRHKDRAIQAWDYERLILERHPFVWQVQLLEAHDRTRGSMPSHVLVVIVPMPTGDETSDPTVPRATPEQLRAVGETLRARMSPFVELAVVNANYVRLRVHARLELVDDEQANVLIERLDAELREWLSPWFYDAERAATGGRYVEDAEIERFVQTRPYVRYVESLRTTRTSDGELAGADWCYLTSARSHAIELVGEDEPVCEGGY